MINLKILALIIFLLPTLNSFSQDAKIGNHDKTCLQLGPSLDDKVLMDLKICELLFIEDGFKYFNELNSGQFSLEIGTDESYINIFFSKINKKIKDRILFKKKQTSINGINYAVWAMENETKYIENKTAKEHIISKVNSNNSSIIPNIINSTRMIIDKELLNNFEGNNYGKILNRSKTLQYLEDPSHHAICLFADVTDGIIIPYQNGTNAKILTVDKIWNRIIYTDKNILQPNGPLALGYGGTGSGDNQFLTPIGIAETYPFQMSGAIEYDIYVADYNNNSINSFIWKIHDNGYSQIYNFIRYNNSNYFKPIDLEIFAQDPSDRWDDFIFFTQDLGFYKRLCRVSYIDAYSGNVTKYQSFKYNNITYYLNPSRISILNISNGEANKWDLLACVDIVLNAVVFFPIRSDGLIELNPGQPIDAIGFFQFPPQYKLTSVKNMISNPAFGVQSWVTMNDANGVGYLNNFKIHFLSNRPIAVEYLATTKKGYHSDIDFEHLNNMEIQNGFLDIFTIEQWTDQRGMRRYKPGIDIVNENFSEYCTNRNNMTLDLKTTNPCRIDFSAKYTNGAIWQDVNINYINGIIWQQGGIAYLPSGSNRLTISCSLPLSDSPPDVIEAVKITARLVPQDEDFIHPNSIQITRVYESHVNRNCNSNGGCPYLYVLDNEGFKQDNNILHKSEIQLYTATDITDKYKLNINPYFDIFDNTCQLQFRELNEDYSYFDKVELKAVDHPVGTILGITESNDIVLYFPNYLSNPDSAILNDSDVTCSLQYDSTCIPVTGDSLDGLITTSGSFKNFNYQRKELFKQLKIIKNLQFDKNPSKKAINDNFDFSSEMIDSIAVIFDPERDFIIVDPVVKDWAGQLIGYNDDGTYNSGYKLFARRENRSEVIVPVGKDVFIDSVYTEWFRDFNISFFCNSLIFYEGYIEYDMPLVSAENSNTGNIFDFLLENDDSYANLDNSSTISMRFQNTNQILPEGWVRDYILITDGRYDNISDRLTKTNINNNIPKVFKLHQNYPNPFNPKATIKFDLPKDVMVSIKVYDILGREVKTLINEFKKAGYHQIDFDGTNYASGVYFYRITAGDFVTSKKMILLK